MAEYAVSAIPFLSQKEYGYQGGKLLITAANGNEQRLNRFVRNLFYRAQVSFSENEIPKYASQLVGNGNTPEDVLGQARQLGSDIFVQSNIAGNTEFVRALYLGFLQRYPDAPGLNWYAGLIANGAVTRDEVREEFANSVEFALRVQELYGNDASDISRTDAFTTYIYNAALQRDPSTAERDTARNDLDLANAKGVNETVTAARALAVNLLSQNNYQQQRAAYNYVLDLYATFLRYPADEAGAILGRANPWPGPCGSLERLRQYAGV